MTFKQSPSPNFSKRTAKIDMVVIHNISLPPNEFGGRYIEDFFQNSKSLIFSIPQFNASMSGIFFITFDCIWITK
jgi:N-acetyl-anhydromuramyl-L-alanine amidase AmpD